MTKTIMTKIGEPFIHGEGSTVAIGERLADYVTPAVSPLNASVTRVPSWGAQRPRCAAPTTGREWTVAFRV